MKSTLTQLSPSVKLGSFASMIVFVLFGASLFARSAARVTVERQKVPSVRWGAESRIFAAPQTNMGREIFSLATEKCLARLKPQTDKLYP